LEVDVGQVAQHRLFGVVEAGAQRRDQAAQVVLNAINSGGDVGGADRLLAPQADEVVLVVVGEAQHLVGYDVADVDDQVPGLVHEGGVEIDGDLPIGHAAGGFAHHRGGNRSHPAHAVAPIVGQDDVV